MEAAFEWESYSVSRAAKKPLLDFITSALEMRGCQILFSSGSGRAPFYVVFETAAGVRRGILAYAFFANTKRTRNRPADEHRFQIKLGGDLKSTLNVAVDPSGLVTTLFLGIDTERKLFVAADPLMNTPAPMSRSIELKAEQVGRITRDGWAAWERDRRPPKAQDRPSFFDEDLRTEVLVGGTKDRLFDLIALEEIAKGLDPGERHHVADQLLKQRAHTPPAPITHDLLHDLDVSVEALLDLIQGASRLKMAVKGWVAETHLLDLLKKIPGVSDCHQPSAEGMPDISLRWKGSAPILIECKNSLRSTYADGRPKVDFQRTRAAKNDPCSRYYKPSDFEVLAACLHAVTDSWEFRFALTRDLPPHEKCQGRIKNLLPIATPLFTDRPDLVFDKCSGL